MLSETIEHALRRESERFDGALIVDDHAGAMACLRSADLSRSIDPPRYEHGNMMEGTVLMLDSDLHRERRRVENPLFRIERLSALEQQEFPEVIATTLDELAHPADDLMRLGGLLATVLSARIAGVDFDERDAEQRELLVDLLRILAQGEAIDASAEEPEAVKARVQQALAVFEVAFYASSVKRRQAAAPGEAPSDLLTVLLGAAHQTVGHLSEQTVRNETAFFFEAGAHTSSQSLANTLHYVLDWVTAEGAPAPGGVMDRALLQRCVHEALRLRPTNPLVRRRAIRDTTVEGRPIREGQVVLVNTYAANRDPSVYGDDAEVYNPLRELPPSGLSYGLSFGAGIHQCIGRTLAIGIPPRAEPSVSENVGIVTLMAEALLRRGVRRDPQRPPVEDAASLRWTRWSTYPVLLDARQ